MAKRTASSPGCLESEALPKRPAKLSSAAKDAAADDRGDPTRDGVERAALAHVLARVR